MPARLLARPTQLRVRLAFWCCLFLRWNKEDLGIELQKQRPTVMPQIPRGARLRCRARTWPTQTCLVPVLRWHPLHTSSCSSSSAQWLMIPMLMKAASSIPCCGLLQQPRRQAALIKTAKRMTAARHSLLKCQTSRFWTVALIHLSTRVEPMTGPSCMTCLAMKQTGFSSAFPRMPALMALHCPPRLMASRYWSVEFPW